MIITNVTGSYFLKQNDTATKMRLFISEADGVTPVDLASAIRLEVVIGVPEGRVLVKTPTILEEPGQLEFGLDYGDLLPTGDDRLEVHVFYSENMKRVAPSKGYYKLRIQEPIDELTTEVTTYTLDYFLAEVRRASQGALDGYTEAINTATSNANEASARANTAASSAETEAESANRASRNAQIAADIATSTISSLEDLQDDLIGYNIPISDYSTSVTYIKGQTVRFNGSSYRAKVVTQGNPLPVPPEVSNTWFDLIAQRGVDGSGSVSSVNGIQPSLNGEVTLTPESLGVVPVSHLSNGSLKHIELVDTLPNSYDNRGILFRKTQTAPNTPERPDYNVELANHVATNASKTVKGHVQIGDGLNVTAGGVVNAYYHEDSTTPLGSNQSEYKVGTTINIVNTASSSQTQADCSEAFYTAMGYNTTNNLLYRFIVTTIKRSTIVRQEIKVIANSFTGLSGVEVATMHRQSSFSSPYNWNTWKVSMPVHSTSGNPNGTVNGMRGFLTLDVLSGILYYKSTGTTAGTNTGWVAIGGAL